MDREQFEKFLKDAMPHIEALQETLNLHNMSGSCLINIERDGFVSISPSYGGMEYYRCPDAKGYIKCSYPVEL